MMNNDKTTQPAPDVRVNGYGPEDKMRHLVFRHPLLLPVLSRFGISLGFGESTIEDVCGRHRIHTATFLAVSNFFISMPAARQSVDLPALVAYLKNSHTYFINFVLPNIRNKLINAIAKDTPQDFAWMLIKLYDQYVDEVKNHMDYEDEHVFKYVMDLHDGMDNTNFDISKFSENHNSISDKLRDLKELFIAHYTAGDNSTDILNSALFDIMNCERDLMLHCNLEDKIFIPAVRQLERNAADEKTENNASSEESAEKTVKKTEIDDNGDVVLTPRERDIVRAIARGLSNKEIADKLFLSVHTVTTHRRNISTKLNIHSPSGLTIYALMHGITTLEECIIK